MNDLLDLRRGEYEPATWFVDESQGRVISVDADVSWPRFDAFMERFVFIQDRQMNVRQNFLAIGIALESIRNERLYLYVAKRDKSMGYSSFYKFCAEVLGFSETTVKNLLNVVQQYCDEEGELKLPYLNFSYSQLVEMLPIDENKRLRIKPTVSKNNIRRLKDYYKIHDPDPQKTVEDDLIACAEMHREEKIREENKRKKLCFVPASSPNCNSQPADGIKNDSSEPDFEDEDSRDIVTANVQTRIPYESIRNGFYVQLSLLREHFKVSGDGVFAKWDEFAHLVETALSNRFPDYIKAYNDSVRMGKLRQQGKKLSLKNEKERREWLENYKDWGVWLDLPELAKRFYRYDFINGDAMIVEEYHVYFSYNYNGESSETVRYGVIDKDHPHYAEGVLGGMTGAVAWLTKHSKEI